MLKKMLYGLTVAFVLVFFPTSVAACDARDCSHPLELEAGTVVEVTLVNPVNGRMIASFIADTETALDVQIDEHIRANLLEENQPRSVNFIMDNVFGFPLITGLNFCAHSFSPFNSNTRFLASVTYPVLVQIIYVNPLTGWTSFREKTRDCYMTIYTRTIYLQCMFCPAVTSSVITHTFHTLC